MTDTIPSVAPSAPPTAQRPRVGDVIVGPIAFWDLLEALAKEDTAARQRRMRERATAADNAYDDALFAAIEGVMSGVMRCLLRWQDRADQEIDRAQLRTWALEDAAVLDGLCAAVPDAPEDAPHSGAAWARGILDTHFKCIDHGPLCWGWAMLREGVDADDDLGASDEFVRNAHHPEYERSARCLDLLGAWPDAGWLHWPGWSPSQFQGLSLEAQPSSARVPAVAVALCNGAWAAAEMMWARSPLTDPQEATTALAAVVRRVALMGRSDEYDPDPLAPARWARRLLAAGADPNTTLAHTLQGRDKSTYHSSSLTSPAGRPANTLVWPAMQAQGWVHAKDGPARPCGVTEQVDMTLSEMVALTPCAMGLHETRTRATTGRGQGAAAAWAAAWEEQWTRVPPRMALPWHAHGSALDVVVHKAAFPFQFRSDGADAQALGAHGKAALRWVHHLAEQEARDGHGWWTRPASAEHPWPAWETVAQLNASNAPNLAALGARMAATLLAVVPGAMALPTWVVRDAALAVVDAAARVTRVERQSDGTHQVRMMREDAWDLVGDLVERLDPVEQPAVAAWVTQARDTIRRTAEDLIETDRDRARVTTDRITLVLATFPAEAALRGAALPTKTRVM